MEKPRRRVELNIEIGANCWDDAADCLRNLSERIIRQGPIENIISGGASSGYIVSGSEDSSVTPEGYSNDIKKYVDSLG